VADIFTLSVVINYHAFNQVLSPPSSLLRHNINYRQTVPQIQQVLEHTLIYQLFSSAAFSLVPLLTLERFRLQ
jgi:hypothetical protein